MDIGEPIEEVPAAFPGFKRAFESRSRKRQRCDFW